MEGLELSGFEPQSENLSRGEEGHQQETSASVEPTKAEQRFGSEYIGELKTPIAVLVQGPDPRLFEEVGIGDEGLAQMRLKTPLTSAVVERLTGVHYKPYLLFPASYPQEKLEPLLKQGSVEASGHFGPYSVYRFLEPGKEGPERVLTFGNRHDASLAVAEVMERAQVPYRVPEIDKKPRIPEREERHFKGILPEERRVMREELEELLEREIIKRLEKSQEVEDYPRQMLRGLESVLNSVFTETEKGENGEPLVLPHDPRWVKWNYCQEYLLPLKEYLEVKTRGLPTSKEESLGEVATAVVDYDFVIDTMKAQSDLLLAEPMKPSHYGTLIPVDKLQGANSGSSTLVFTKDQLIIESDQQSRRFPLPEKSPQGEIAIKGGLARLVAKVSLGLPVEDELPLSDVDLVFFGEKVPLQHLKAKYGVEVRDIEKIRGDASEYLGDRDQSVNEVLLTHKGLVTSLNALSAYFQNTTEASADPVKTIHGSHVLNVYRGYFGEGSDVADYFFVKGTRFPSPRALSRMYRFLIEGKADSITLPEGSLKMDIGIHWLVMARKFMEVEDLPRRRELLERMVKMANLTNSPYFHEDFLKSKYGPERFIKTVQWDLLLKGTLRKPFAMTGDLSEKETLNWIASRLVRQMLGRFDFYLGYDKEKSFARRLTAKDLRPTQLVLPRSKDYEAGTVEAETEAKTSDKLVWENSPRNRAGRLFNYFSREKLPLELRQEEEIKTYLEAHFPLSRSYEPYQVFFIPEEKRDEFVAAARQSKLVPKTFQARPLGMSLPNVFIDYLMVDSRSSIIKTQALFEELFHNTAEHEVVGRKGWERAGGFVKDASSWDGAHRGRFFEEALANLAWRSYCREKGLDPALGIETESTIFGRVLREVLRRSPDAGKSLYDSLLKARLLSNEEETRSRELIDDILGRGTFEELMSIREFRKDIAKVGTIYSKLGLNFPYSVTVLESID